MSDYSSDFEIAAETSRLAPGPKRRNINVVEPMEGEANVKGFVSAFQTIMGRSGTLQKLEEQQAGSAEAVVAVSAKKSSPVSSLACHNKTPLVTENEEALAGTAKRGVLKLFKAMSMKGRRKPVRVERRGRPLSGTVGPASMASFLEMLKAQKNPSK